MKDKYDTIKATFKEVNYELGLPINDLEWLAMSAAGRLCGNFIVKELLDVMKAFRVACDVSSSGGVLVLLTFESVITMDTFFKDDRGSFKECLEDIKAWNSSDAYKKFVFWVKIKKVLLQCLHERFLMPLGNSWGNFVKLDDSIMSRKQLDVARMLVSIDSRLSIHYSIFVNSIGKLYEILISVDKTQFESLCVGDDSFDSSHSDFVCEVSKDGWAAPYWSC
ncbi:hypothetical protein REPUB_Repub12eG0052300 [Reevesia pubescens]